MRQDVMQRVLTFVESERDVNEYTNPYYWRMQTTHNSPAEALKTETKPRAGVEGCAPLVALPSARWGQAVGVHEESASHAHCCHATAEATGECS